MSLASEVVDALRAAMSRTAAMRESINGIRDQADEVILEIRQASDGSSDDRPAEAVVRLQQAQVRLDEAKAELDAGDAALEVYIAEGLGGGGCGSNPDRDGADGTSRLSFGARSRLAVDDLEGIQQGNYRRFNRKLPSAAEPPVITAIGDGAVRFEAKVPGRVPGSYALYSKTIDAQGRTIAYEKTTVVPDGSIAHVKDKMRK